MRSSLNGNTELFLADLSAAQDRLSRAQRQISSGKRIQSASDAPDEVGPLLQLRAALARNTQIKTNLGRASTEAKSAEQSLDQALKLLDRAVTIASQAGGPSATSDVRQNLAMEVQGLLETTVSLSRTQVEGRYIFSGDLDQYPAYEIDLNSGTGVAELTVANATRRMEDPAGGTFATSKTARDIFDLRNAGDTLAEGNVFNALNSLRVALASDDTAAITSAAELVRTASDHINSQIAYYGTVQRRIDQGTDFASSYAVRLQTSISDKEDADVTAAALELTQASTQVQASLEARAKLPRTTLFDFLG
jgi:flagellar hook-associated protein 3 FlgL